MLGSKNPIARAACVLGVFAALTGAAAASTVLVDRGLPTANLNNAAGANRSNVAWVDGTYTSASDYWLIGDSFKNTSSQAWNIDTIRMWTVGATSTAKLWGGVEGSSIGILPGAGTISPSAYVGPTSYQGYSGAYRDMFQVDFAVNITLQAGETFDFFLDGTGGQYVVPFASASNAALSGSPQQGSDGVMFDAQVDGVAGVVLANTTWSSLGTGWDKASDLNVQVYGNAVPEPTSLALVGLALLGAYGARRRKA